MKVIICVLAITIMATGCSSQEKIPLANASNESSVSIPNSMGTNSENESDVPEAVEPESSIESSTAEQSSSSEMAGNIQSEFVAMANSVLSKYKDGTSSTLPEYQKIPINLILPDQITEENLSVEESQMGGYFVTVELLESKMNMVIMVSDNTFVDADGNTKKPGPVVSGVAFLEK